jgi:hypothetical protein
MITVHKLADYETFRYDLLVTVEVKHSDPYVDSRQNPTIGIGFDLNGNWGQSGFSPAAR